MAQLIRAAVAHQRGDASRALQRLSEAEAGFEKLDMRLFLQACRYRRGELDGGDDGKRLTEVAAAWMSSEGIVNPAKMVRMLAPGFGGATL